MVLPGFALQATEVNWQKLSTYLQDDHMNSFMFWLSFFFYIHICILSLSPSPHDYSEYQTPRKSMS